MLAAGMKELRVPLGKWDILDDGDDCCLIVEHEYKQQVEDGLPAWFRRCGHDLKIDGIVTRLEDVSFCASRLVRVDGVAKMIMEPARVIGKSRLHPRPFTGRFRRKYVATIGQCQLAIHTGVPVLQAHALMLKRCSTELLKELPRSYLYRLAREDNPWEATPTKVSQSSRESFAAAFKISLADQLYYESIFDRVTPEEYLREAPPNTVPPGN